MIHRTQRDSTGHKIPRKTKDILILEHRVELECARDEAIGPHCCHLLQRLHFGQN